MPSHSYLWGDESYHPSALDMGTGQLYFVVYKQFMVKNANMTYDRPMKSWEFLLFKHLYWGLWS